jgi:uncharacterized caspase-like protein
LQLFKGTTRSVGRGLARIEPTGDILVAYSAKHGTLAQDGVGRNSPFASALLKHIAEPGLDIRLAFGRIRDDVLRGTFVTRRSGRLLPRASWRFRRCGA